MKKWFSFFNKTNQIAKIGEYYSHAYKNDIIKIVKEYANGNVSYIFIIINDKPLYNTSSEYVSRAEFFPNSPDWIKLDEFTEPVLIVPNENDTFIDKQWGDNIIKITKISQDKTKVRYKYTQIQSRTITSEYEHEMDISTLNRTFISQK